MRISLFQTLLWFSLSEFTFGASCNHDNCLNAMNNHLASASAFCTPYLATTQTATTGIPTFLANCQASTSRLSSACSCVLTSTVGKTTSPTLSPTSSHSGTTSPVSSPSPLSCIATATITPLASTVTQTVTTGSSCSSSPLTCPSIGGTSTITSVSTITATATVTTTALPSCFPHINGGDFTSSSANLGAFTVVQSPPGTILNEILTPSQEGLVTVSDGTPQFLFVNFEILPIPSTYTLQQFVGTVCAPYTSLTLSATIDTQSEGGTIQFCISATNCSTAQPIPASNGRFTQYSASFPIPTGTSVTASLILAATDFVPEFFAGIGNFQVSPF